LCAGLACCVSDFTPTEAQTARPAAEGRRSRMALIPPGTVIGREAPEGWSHLVIKTYPRPGAGDLDRVNDNTMRLASFIFTAFVADVRGQQVRGDTRYRLERIAIGLGTNINGRETIISPDTQKRLGANLGLLARTVFNKAYEMQREAAVVARSDTLGVVDTVATMLRDGKHRPVVFRYVLLVDPRNGRLDTLLWVIDRDGEGRYTGAVGPIQWLARTKIETVVLHVDGNEFTLGVPSENAFAAQRPPQGDKEIALPEELKSVAAQPRLSDEAARQLDARLRDCLARAAAR
jgi:hypothetical protein